MAASIGMVTIDCAQPEQLAPFWRAVLDAEPQFEMPEFIVLKPASGGPSLGLQKVSEPKTVKNRVHLDLGAEDRAAEVARIVELGGSVVAEHEMSGYPWTVMADPAGNEFCVGASSG